MMFILSLVSCKSEKQEVKEINVETRGVKEYGNKFSNENNVYLILKLDGTFEGSFKGDEIMVGNWVKENDGKILKLISVKSNEGKGVIYSKQFTILEHTDDLISLIDNEGKNLKLKSE